MADLRGLACGFGGGCGVVVAQRGGRQGRRSGGENGAVWEA